jgi:hypothetical protein
MRRKHLVAGTAGALVLGALTSGCATDGANGEDLGGRGEPIQETGGGDQAEAPGELVPIRVGGIEIQVEIADSEAERSRGLMFRESLPENQGMLFVYDTQRETLGFWMRNTLIPLDIAYADREGRIVDIRQMEPRDERTVSSAAPAMYALEMNQGWFEKNGVRVGDRIEF